MNANVILFPEFEPNQILTSTQLNLVREQLDVQDRSGRLRLVGSGRVCGLSFQRGGTPHVLRLRAGFGVSSEGHLIEVAEPIELTHYRSYTDPDLEQGVAPARPAYAAWRMGAAGAQVPMFELLDAESAGAAGSQAQPLTEDVGTDHVVVAYLERRREELRSCLVTDCDNKGTNIRLALVTLLVPKAQLAALEPCPAAPVWVRIPRVGSLAAVADEIALDARFQGLIDDHVGPLQAAIGGLLARLRIALELEGVELPDLSAKLAGGSAQYRYDALRDIATAYNEALTAACELEDGCFGTLAFPRHLMLGEWDGAGNYRHSFYPSPVRHVTQRGRERVRALVRRLVALMQQVDFAGAGAGLALTPSHTEARPLGERAIPFYYALGGGPLEALWQPALCCTTVPLWARAQRGAALEFDYARSTLLRVEPLVGASTPGVLGMLEHLRAQHNVEFDVILSCFSDPFEAERTSREALAKELSERREAQQEFREFGWVFFSGNGSESEARDLLQSISQHFRSILGYADALENLGLPEPLCDCGPLQVAYLQTRSKVLGALGRARGYLAKLEIVAAGSLLEQPLVRSRAVRLAEGIRGAALDAVIARALARAAADETGGDAFSELEQAMERVRDAPPEECASDAIEFARQAAVRVTALVERALPGKLLGFSFELFSALWKEAGLRLLAFALLRQLWERVLDGSSEVDGNLSPGTHLGREEAQQALAGVFAGVEDGLLGELSALAAAYAATRDADYSSFSNLRAGVSGLEHLAGVPPGGTLVLLCSGTPVDGTVVADFGLFGKLPCRCHAALDQLCVPPVAALDYRIVTVAAQGEPVEIDIALPVGSNDFSLLAGASGGGADALSLGLERDVTLLGAKLTVKQDRTIGYRGTATAGALDEFGYELVRQTGFCPGSDQGSVLVLMAPAFAKPVVVGGAKVSGVVLHDNAGFTGATVMLAGVGEQQSGDLGFYEFQRVPAGAWELRATFQGGGRRLESEVLQLEVQAGEDVPDQRLVLKPRVLRVAVLEAGTTDKWLGGAVVSTDEKSDTTDGNGIATLEDLPASVFLRVTLARYRSYGNTVSGSGELQVRLRRSESSIHPQLVEIIAESRHLAKAEARQLADDLFNERYLPRLQAFERFESLPDFRESPAQRASRELFAAIEDAERPLEELVRAYERAAEELSGSPNRTAARALLELITLTLLDRVLISSDPSADPRGLLEPVLSIAARGGLAGRELSKLWNAADLAERLGTGRASGGIEELIGGR